MPVFRKLSNLKEAYKATLTMIEELTLSLGTWFIDLIAATMSGSSEDLLSSELRKELIVVNFACELLIISLDKSLQLFVRHIHAVSGEEFAQVILVDVAVLILVY